MPSGQAVEIGGYVIPDAMVYVAGNRAPAEASAIDPSLQIARAPATGEAAELGYWTRYDRMTPGQRAAYLQWLAWGRRDHDPSSRDFGYLFLFFYGLERRMILEGQADQAMLRALTDMMEQYAAHGRSQSLPSYITQLLHYWAYGAGQEYYRSFWPKAMQLPKAYMTEDSLALVLANLFESGMPLPAKVALAVARSDQETKNSIVVRRRREEFERLFHERYAAETNGGLLLKAAKRPRRVEYTPASPTLAYAIAERRMRAERAIPNVLGIPSQFKVLRAVWNSCVDDLKAFDRAAKKEEEGAGSLAAYLALPPDLQRARPHPLADAWDELIESHRVNGGIVPVRIEKFAGLLALEPRNRLTAKRSREVADLVQSFDYAIEPDARGDATVAYSWDEEVVIFRPLNAEAMLPSKPYGAASALLQICFVIAGADGEHQREELDLIQNFIMTNLALDPFDRQRLQMLSGLLMRDPERAVGALRRVSKIVPAHQKDALARVLVYIAAADGVVRPEELKVLKRSFKALEIPGEVLESLLDKVRETDDTVPLHPGRETPAPTARGEAIPSPPGAEPAAEKKTRESGFEIDMAKVQAISEETREVIGILAKAFEEHAEEDDAEDLPPELAELVPPAPAPEPAPPAGGDPPDWMADLDLRFIPATLELIARGEWTKAQFDALAARHNLMPLGLYGSVNDWADEALGDLLLDGDDPITIDRDLIPREDSTP
ncbi:MAG: TerB N-terminal domain-containing protein [Sumerlaeia bacterium]